MQFAFFETALRAQKSYSRLMDQPYKPSNKQGMSFGATVGAVILGVICALLLLSIL